MDEFELCRFIKTDSEMGCMTCLQNQRTQGKAHLPTFLLRGQKHFFHKLDINTL